MKDLEIRKITTNQDAKLCARLMSDSEPWITLKRDYQKSLNLFNNSSKEHYIVYLKKQFAGFILLEMKGVFAGYIQSIAVVPKLQNKRIGKELLRFAEERIFKELENTFICVSSFNHDVKKMYLKYGYEIIGELKDFVVKGQSEILLRKQK
jgi:[ribosomal protein S18]-alanine N-acetyltransferase